MRTIKQDELFQSLNDFLKVKGIELKDGAYAQRIRRACNLLGDTINTTRQTARKAKDKVDEKLDGVRQSIHEATAPKPPAGPAPKQASQAAPKTRKARASRNQRAVSAKRNRKQ
jgi:hypothetical protein